MLIKLGDVIIFLHGSELRSVRVLRLPKQRGSALIVLDFYEDAIEMCFVNTNEKFLSLVKN